ncbi:MAG: GntR family transcriptional regulator [Sphingomonadales bacterium]|jgi:GntR family transcriptional regulator|nr:GntR family transcriptional regulator [Sphingomonadales bacterium]
MTVDTERDIPVYLRLRGMIAIMIIEGRYREGEQLPSVRAFAAETQTNPLTVAKAYQCLQDEGHVTVRRGVGMFVALGAVERLRVQEREIFLTKIWPRMRGIIGRLGISMDELFESADA